LEHYLNRNHKLVKVYRASGELEALTIKSMLESFGVPAMLRSNAAVLSTRFQLMAWAWLK
jgi:hypothetical protein